MDFLNGIIGSLNGAAAQLQAEILQLFMLVVVIAQYLFNLSIFFEEFNVGMFIDANSFLSTSVSGFFKSIFVDLVHGVVFILKWVSNILKPILEWISKIQKIIDRIYNTYVKPILKWIQITRTFLKLLRALGVKWAAKLDSILGTVQHDIQAAFLYVRGILNTIADIINIAVDPTKLLRRPTLILSVRRTLHALIRQVTGLPPGFFMPSPSAFAPTGVGALPFNFNPNDSSMNPPPSYYLAFDDHVQSFSELRPGEVIDDTAVDDVPAWSFFAVDADILDQCDDVDGCLKEAINLLTGRA